MGDVAIRVDGLGKLYHLGGARQPYATLGEQIKKITSVRKLLRRAKRTEANPPFWALKDVCFEVKRGEVVGVIGRNGAGKSTLLKILSRITEPTEGAADIHGRVGSLLEVGTGFHPELTGRENIYLNGAILGMHRSDIRRKFDAIVSFAEVEKFIDTAVKHYSSGMYTRLAFAVAAHLEPDILIVDEVLAVGDAEFQKKCLGKMGEVAQGGRTVLFVSHQMPTVANLCQRVVWLEKGGVRTVGPARAVVAEYTALAAATSAAVVELAAMPRPAGVGTRVRLERLEWLTPLPLHFGHPARLRLHLRAAGPAEDVALGVGFNLPDGQRFLTYESDDSLPGENLPAGVTRAYDLSVPAFPVGPGRYGVDVGVRSGDRAALDAVLHVADVEVVGTADTPTYIMQFDNVGVRIAEEWAPAAQEVPL